MVRGEEKKNGREGARACVRRMNVSMCVCVCVLRVCPMLLSPTLLYISHLLCVGRAIDAPGSERVSIAAVPYGSRTGRVTVLLVVRAGLADWALCSSILP
jgi:hypothetical protein